jgi:hypothetical protein
MATAPLMSAVERLRERGQAPATGPISVRNLIRQVQPDRRGSVRGLMSKVFASTATFRPYAVILCRFKGDPPDPAREAPIERFFQRLFTPGTGGVIEYWRSASLGKVDVTGSRVFDWTEIDIPRAKAGSDKDHGGIGREALIDAAVNAVNRRGGEPLAGFFKPIAVFSYDWADEAQQQGWIDGSADGQGRVSAPPHGHNGDFVAHEIGHGFGLDHDGGPQNQAYYDPCCVMSNNNRFQPDGWPVNFAPALCLPHLMQMGWMYPRRTYVDTGGWMDRPDGISVPLGPINRPIARGNLGITLALRPRLDWDYYLEYVTPTGWNVGVNKPYLFIRRFGNVPGVGAATSQYLALIEIPDRPDVAASVHESMGDTIFEARLTTLQPGPVIRVTATKG